MKERRESGKEDEGAPGEQQGAAREGICSGSLSFDYIVAQCCCLDSATYFIIWALRGNVNVSQKCWVLLAEWFPNHVTKPLETLPQNPPQALSSRCIGLKFHGSQGK
jgi:hypothetical protein